VTLHTFILHTTQQWAAHLLIVVLGCVVAVPTPEHLP